MPNQEVDVNSLGKAEVIVSTDSKLEIRKNREATIRVGLSDYKGMTLLQFMETWLTPSGDYAPSKKIVSMRKPQALAMIDWIVANQATLKSALEKASS